MFLIQKNSIFGKKKMLENFGIDNKINLCSLSKLQRLKSDLN